MSKKENTVCGVCSACAALIRDKDNNGYCKDKAKRLPRWEKGAIFLGDGYYLAPRCIEITPDKCRPKPFDMKTGEPIKRKFVVEKEGDKERWWEDS